MKRFTTIPLRDWLVGARADQTLGESSSRQHRRRVGRVSAARRRISKRRSQLEKLEQRHLLAAVTGEVFLDLNQDGLRQPGETGAVDVRVYLDDNANGVLDGSEVVTTTDVDGVYSFPQVNEGNYQIRVAPSPGFVQTAPSLTYGWNDTVVQDREGQFFRAAQLFQVDGEGMVESIGQPTRSRMDGLVQIGDDSLIGIDSRSDEVFRINPLTGERSRIAESNLDLVGGLAYDRVSNAVYTLARGGSDPTTRTLARLDTNTGRASLIGGGLSGLNTVTDLIFDPVNRRIVGFDNDDDEFFTFDLNGAGRTLARAGRLSFNPVTGLPVTVGGIDADSMAMASAEQLVGVLPNGPVATSTYVWMFDADDNDRTSTLLVEIPDAVPNFVETATVRNRTTVSESVRPVALARSTIGNNSRDIALTQFETRTGVNFGVAADVIGFRLVPSNPVSGPGALTQAGVTVVGGAILADFVEITLNRMPTSNVTLNLSLTSTFGGEPGVVLDVNRLTFTPQDWQTPRRIQLTPDMANLVAVITPSVLTATVDVASSDVLWRSLPAQTLPVRVLPPLTDERLSVPVINELLVEGRFTSAVNGTRDQYIELRGKPNETLPVGTYFVVVEEGIGRIGQINTVIDLSGQSFGANGFLVLLQGSNTYETEFGANVLQSDLSGFNGLPGGIFSSAQTDGSLDSFRNDASYMLLQSDIAPLVGVDIDTNNDGLIDPISPAANWDVYDSVAMHYFNTDESSFSPIVFVETGSIAHPIIQRNSRGQTIVETDGYGYVGRIGDSIGSDYEDWVFGSVDDVEPGFWGGELDPIGLYELRPGESSFPALYDHALDHVGGSNFVGGVRGRITLLPSNGDLLNGTPADTRLPAEGITVFVDTNANGIRDDLVFTVEPDDAAPPFDINNPFPNDAEYPLTQFYDGVTITWDRGSSFLVSDDIVSRRQRVGSQIIGNRIFSAGPFDTFYESNRLRFDFFQPIRSASIDVLNDRFNGFVYGRLDAFNANGDLVATSISSAVASSRRGTVTVSAPDEQIVRIEAYGDDNFSTSFFRTSFDSFSYIQSEPGAVTDQNGIFEISGLFPGSYELAVAGTAEVSNLLENSTRQPFTVSKYENFFFESEFRPNTLPTLPGGSDVTFTLDENPAVGTVIATVDAFDADNAGLVYEFVGGDSTGLELLVRPDFTAEIRVNENADLNFEAGPRRVLQVRATDEFGASVTARVILQLNDINEPPVVSIIELAVPEGAAVGTVIGRIDAFDPDAGASQRLTYTVLPSTEEAPIASDASSFFVVDELTGVVTLISPLDFETLRTMVLRVKVDDNTGSTGQASGIAIVDKTIRVSDENDAPQIVTSTFTVSESATGELVALQVFDPDAGQTHTFTLVEGNALLRLAPDGKIFLAAGKQLDFETNPQLQLIVAVSDNGNPSLASTQTITLNLENVNETATLSRSSNENNQASENVPGLLITTLSLVDPEGKPETYQFDLQPGPSSDLFRFDPATGDLRLAEGVALDFESKAFHDLTFEIVDLTAELPTTYPTYRVFVNNVNEPPVVTTSKIFVSEVPRPGDEVGRILVVDPDTGFPGAVLSIELIGGTAGPFFEFETAANSPNKPAAQIDPLLLKVRSDFDLAAFKAIDPQSLNLQVRVSDGNSSSADLIDVEIELNQVNESPEFNASLLASTFAGQRVTTGTTFRMTLPEDIAIDPENENFLIRVGQKVRDTNGNLVFDEAGRVKLEMPAWLTYNEQTRELVASPSGAISGRVELVIRALEIGPFPLSQDADVSLLVSPQTNVNNRYDVTGDGVVTALDALRIINFAFYDEGLVATPGSLSDSLVYLDVSGDSRVTLVDAVQVINELNRQEALTFNPASEPSSEPASNPIGSAVSWSLEDQRRRELATDEIFGESNLF